MEKTEQYVTLAEYTDMMSRIADTIKVSGNTIDALRTVTLLLAAALAKQKNLDAEQFMRDISFMIDNHYPQDSGIPTVVLDFRAELAKAIPTKA